MSDAMTEFQILKARHAELVEMFKEMAAAPVLNREELVAKWEAIHRLVLQCGEITDKAERIAYGLE